MARRAIGRVDEGDRYNSPLVTRNASAEMADLFSPRRRALEWRRVWVALAESQHELGLGVSTAAVRALKRGLTRIDLAAAARHERHVRHDLVAHLLAYADVAPAARRVLHLGATSMDVVDNADVVVMRCALERVRDWLVNVVLGLGEQARLWRDLPCLGFTHFQPAQVTTVGKRISLWAWDFARDLEEIETRLERLRLRGLRGATGTQASFLELCDGSAAKVARLERAFARRLGFEKCEPVTGQTYSRKVDGAVISALAGVAASVHKMANDVRLLANLREMEEPFERGQVGSSAMAYKRNPMLSERATGLARFVIALSQSAWQTAAEQWLERTLDDSSNKRLVVPEAFLAVDGMMQIVLHIGRGLVVYPRVIAARLAEEIPFMATERILLEAVKAGGDRQALHERIRRHSVAAAREVKERGGANDLMERLRGDVAFGRVRLERAVRAEAFVGLAPRQVDQFLREVVGPIRKRHRGVRRMEAEIRV